MTKREAAAAAAASAAGAFLLLADSLLSAGRTLPSLPLTDMTAHAVPTLTYLGAALAQGRAPLWNSLLFSGFPFLGDFEPAVLYPLNWLAAPLGAAATLALSCWLHAALAAFATYVLCRRLGSSRLGSASGAASYALAGPTILLLAPGHVGPFAVAAWAPVLLLSLEAWVRTRRLRWALGAAAASALQWLAGYPQMAYMSALACGACALWDAARSNRPAPAAVGTAAALAGACALAAAQLLPGLDAASESIRASGLAADQAARFAMPPENLLTALSPWALGGLGSPPYFGRGYIWEHCLFWGRGSLALAVVGLAADARTRRYGALAGLALLFSLGPATPLFSIARSVLPGFSALRGSAKALFLVPLLLAPAIAAGLDAALERAGARRLAWTALALAALCALLGACVSFSPAAFARAMSALGQSGGELAPELYRAPGFLRAAARWSSSGFAAAAGVFAVWGAVAFLAPPRARVRLAAALVALELMGFAWSGRVSGPAHVAGYPSAWLEAARTLAVGERVLHDPFAYPNAALLAGEAMRDIWGYAALVPRRYAEFIAGTQGIPPASAQNLFPIRREHPALDLTRLRLVFDPRPGLKIRRREGSMPAARLVGAARVLPREAALAAVLDRGFAFEREAVVEEALGLDANGPARGKVDVARRRDGSIELEVESAASALVLVSEAYSRGWRARGLDGGSYRVVAADYAFLGVPVGPGRHRIALEFRPASFILGLLISALALVSWIILWIARPL